MQRVNVTGRGRRAMADLMRTDGVQVVRQTLRDLGGGRYRVQAFGEADDLTRLAQAGFDVEHIEDVPSGPPAMPGPPEVGAGPRRRRGPIPLPAPPSGPGGPPAATSR